MEFMSNLGLPVSNDVALYIGGVLTAGVIGLMRLLLTKEDRAAANKKIESDAAVNYASAFNEMTKTLGETMALLRQSNDKHEILSKRINELEDKQQEDNRKILELSKLVRDMGLDIEARDKVIAAQKLNLDSLLTSNRAFEETKNKEIAQLAQRIKELEHESNAVTLPPELPPIADLVERIVNPPIAITAEIIVLPQSSTEPTPPPPAPTPQPEGEPK